MHGFINMVGSYTQGGMGWGLHMYTGFCSIVVRMYVIEQNESLVVWCGSC